MTRLQQSTFDDYTREIERKQEEIERKLRELAELPRQVEEEMRERDATIPPPDLIAEEDRKRHLEDQITLGEIRNERRAQGRSLLLMMLLLASIASLTLWAIRIATS